MVSRDGSGQEAGRVPASGGVVGLDQRFGQDGLHGLRAAVASHAGDLGGDRRCVGCLLVIANELATNAIMHGGGGGRLRLWREDNVIFCQVSDTGAGLADPLTAGQARPALSARTGRGLWLVRQLSDEFAAQTGPQGTVMTAGVSVDTTGR